MAARIAVESLLDTWDEPPGCMAAPESAPEALDEGALAGEADWPLLPQPAANAKSATNAKVANRVVIQAVLSLPLWSRNAPCNMETITVSCDGAETNRSFALEITRVLRIVRRFSEKRASQRRTVTRFGTVRDESNSRKSTLLKRTHCGGEYCQRRRRSGPLTKGLPRS